MDVLFFRGSKTSKFFYIMELFSLKMYLSEGYVYFHLNVCVFHFFFEFLFVYMGVRLSVHDQNYGGCSFSPKALKMTCQFWGSPNLNLRMFSAKTVNSGKKIKS